MPPKTRTASRGTNTKSSRSSWLVWIFVLLALLSLGFVGFRASERRAATFPQSNPTEVGVGIDLGLGSTKVAVKFSNASHEPQVLEFEGKRSIPGVIGFDGRKILYGEEARLLSLQHPERTLNVTTMHIPPHSTEVQSKEWKFLHEGNHPYVDVMVSDSMLTYKIDTGTGIRRITMAEVLKLFFTHIKDQILIEVGRDKQLFAVLSVPCAFSDHQRSAIKNAAQAAGLKVARVANEPTLAAVGYGMSQLTGEANVTMIHLDPEYPRISILNMEDGVYEILYDAPLKDFEGEISSSFTRIIGDAVHDRIWKSWLQPAMQRLMQRPSHEELSQVSTVDSGRESDTLRWSIIRHLGRAGVAPEAVQHVIVTGNSPLVESVTKSLFPSATPKPPPTPPGEELAVLGAAHQSQYFLPSYWEPCTLPIAINTLSLGVVNADDQVRIRLVEGESLFANATYRRDLGTFTVPIPAHIRGLRGETVIEVGLDLIDDEGWNTPLKAELKVTIQSADRSSKHQLANHTVRFDQIRSDELDRYILEYENEPRTDIDVARTLPADTDSKAQS